MKLYLISNKGQSLLEILLILVIVSGLLTIALITFRSNLLLKTYTSNYFRAQEIAYSEIERLRNLAKTNFDQITNQTSTIDNFYKEEILVTDLDSLTKKIDIILRWQEEREKIFKTTFYLTNWKNAPIDDGSGGAGGGGGGGLSGDWRYPITFSSIDLGPGNAGTDVNVKFSTVFISSVASDEKKPDLFIIDASDPRNPFIKSSINTGKGVNSLSVKGNYAYLAHAYGRNQLQIVDISNENLPFLVNQISLPNNSSPALSIFAFGNYVVIGTQWSIGKEIFIYDVSNVGIATPTLVSSIEAEISGDFYNVYDLFVLNNKLYVASGNGYNSGKILIYNIATPTSPVLIGQFSANKTFYSIFPLSNNLLFAGTQDLLYLLDTSNLSNIRVLGTYNSGGVIYDIYARENLAFLATGNPNTEFQIVNYSAPQNLYLYSSYNFPQQATGVDYRNNLVFVSVRSNDALRIITSR